MGLNSVMCGDCCDFEFVKPSITRRMFLGGSLAIAGILAASGRAMGLTKPNISMILGRPTNRTAALSVMSDTALSAYVEYGNSKGKLDKKSSQVKLEPNTPFEFELVGLRPNSRTYYRLVTKIPETDVFSKSLEFYFSTQPKPGSAFTFAMQGDSHPERAGQMFNADLYNRTLRNVEAIHPDFYIMLGDDFSIDPLISKGQASKSNIESVYRNQRNWLTQAASSVPLFLVNGNHEQAAKYLLDGTPNNPAVLAGNARIKYFPLPDNNDFYSGDKEEVQFVGRPRDYYSWTWGDALFITLDPYWHSESAVDNVAGVDNPNANPLESNSVSTQGGGKKGTSGGGDKSANGKQTDLWKVGIGDDQYLWFKKTLEAARAQYIFVFAHHVLGTGRGAIEVSRNYEWGGEDPKGISTFAERRPNWELPIHQLMVKHKVSAFFQGHDHLYCQQERDGIIYQEVANPADNSFTAFNESAYKSGVKLPNSGHLQVTVTPTQAKVEYVLSARPQDETASRKNGQIAHSYVIKPRSMR